LRNVRSPIGMRRVKEIGVRIDRHSRRTDLFLVRIWTSSPVDGSGESHWHGRVQRTVNGETYLFDSWQGLIEKLNAMISAEDEGRRQATSGTSKPEGKGDGAVSVEEASNENR
jgi:hypothetical protein